jgi:tryptophan 2,3-dioxygenase
MKTQAEYKQLRELTKKRWEDTIQHDESERDKELSALDLAWELIQKQQVPATISIADMMRKVIAKLEQPFQSWQVQEKMVASYPALADSLRMKTISGHLTRMVGRHELEMIDPGSGTTPGRYKIKALKTK